MSDDRYSLEDRIAYHDSVCNGSLCDADISMYPTPPDGWKRDEGKNPDDVVKTRRILVTSENISEVAKDIQMEPTKLARMYMGYKLDGMPLIFEVLED